LPRRLDQTGRHGWGALDVASNSAPVAAPCHPATPLGTHCHHGDRGAWLRCGSNHWRDPCTRTTPHRKARARRRISRFAPAPPRPVSRKCWGRHSTAGTASGRGSSVRFPQGASPNRGGFQLGPRSWTANHFLRTENAVSNFTAMPAYTPGQVAHGDHAIVGYTISPSMDNPLWKSAQPLGNAASCRFRDG
jgi:hypothetical protein